MPLQVSGTGRGRRTAFRDGQQLVDGYVPQHIDSAADPADFDLLDPLVLGQAEMEPRAEVALVAAAAVHLVHLL